MVLPPQTGGNPPPGAVDLYSEAGHEHEQEQRERAQQEQVDQAPIDEGEPPLGQYLHGHESESETKGARSN